MRKLSKLSPYAKAYLAGAGVLGVGGAAGGALLQRKGVLQGDEFKKMSPEERKARIRRQRTIGALGGAARGLALNHIGMNTVLSTGNRKKDVTNIAGGAALMGLGGGYADYKRVDDASLRAVTPREYGESALAYKNRIKMMRGSGAAMNVLGAAQFGIGAAHMRDQTHSAFQAQPGNPFKGQRDLFNNVFSGGFKKGWERFAAGAAGAAGGGGPRSKGADTAGGFTANKAYGYTADMGGTRKAGQDFAGFAPDLGDLGKELKKAQGDKGAAAALRKKLKKAYRKAVVTHHPDKGGDEAKFQHLSQAYENIDNFLEKNSAWLRLYGHSGFCEKIANASARGRVR